MPKRTEKYVGINNDLYGGMTAIGKTIRDARVFGIIEESEACEGWSLAAIDSLLHRVNGEWDKYGCLVSNLPDDLYQRHQRIHGEAIELARAAGWSGELETNDEN